jgi:hypothetical protein
MYIYQKINEMRKKIALVCMLFVGVITFGQTLNLEWSEKMEYDKEAGYLNQLIGESDKYVFASIYDYKTKLLDDGSKIKMKCKLVAYNKATKKEELSINIMGYSNTKSTENAFSNLEYYKSIKQNNVIYVFWLSQQTVTMLKSELYCQTFDLSLKPLQPLKKICELPCSENKVKDPAFIICTNPTKENIIIVSESSATEATQNKNYKIEVRTINSNLAISKSINIEVPYSSKSDEILPIYGEYTQLNDGNLFIKAQKNFLIINPTLNKKLTLGNKIEGKLIMSLKSYTENNVTKYIGTYVTKESENLAEKKSGIFTFEMDENLFKPSKVNFIEFNQEQLNTLYPKLDKKEVYILFGNNKTDKNLMNYEIDELINSNGKLILFATKTLVQNNTFTSSQTGSNTNTYIYKDDIVPIVFSNNVIEKLMTPIKRTTSYADVVSSDDMFSLNTNSHAFLIFGWDVKDTKRIFGVGADDDEIEMKQNRLYYWVTNLETGQTEIKFIHVNNKKSKNFVEKYITPEKYEFQGTDNYYYIGSAELTLMGNDGKKPKFIGQLSITK